MPKLYFLTRTKSREDKAAFIWAESEKYALQMWEEVNVHDTQSHVTMTRSTRFRSTHAALLASSTGEISAANVSKRRT